MRRRFAVAVAFLLATVLPSFSQTSSTAILGTITDSSGAVLVGAKVTVLQVQTGIKRQDTTSGTGDYNFPLLDPGDYSVTVEAPGFKTETRSGIQLELNLKARIDFHMEVGTETQTVEVTSQAALLSTDQATLGQVVNTRRVEELPLNGRNVGALAVLQPGVQYGGRMGLTDLSGGSGGVPIPGDTIAIGANGQRDVDQHATLDGVAVTEARINTVPFTPSPEAIEEFKVQAGTYSAEYGTHSGAQLAIALKSGGNAFHGDVFEFLRNDKLDAQNYFQNYFNPPGSTPTPKDLLRQNQYGFLLTGPILIPKIYSGKNRTFFMFDFESHRLRQPNQVGQALYPTQAFEDGDMSALLNRHDSSGNALPAIQIIDPITGVPFAGDIIPASRISPIAKNLFQFFPAPQFALPDPLSGFNYIGVGATSIDDDQRYVRIDHQLTNKDKLFGHYAFDDIKYGQTYGDNPNFPYFVAGRNQNAAAQWIHIFTPSIINEFRLGYMRSVDNTLNPRSNTNFSLDALGLTGLRVLTDHNRPFTSREAGLPPIYFDHFAAPNGLGDRDGGNGFDYNNQYELGDNVTISHGAHNFKTGFMVTRVVLDRGAANVPRGDLTYGDDVANSDWASFLLGYPDATDSPEGIPLTFPRQNRYAVYFQDDWKVTQRLTVNLGLRYEYNTVATDVKGLWRSLDFTKEVNGIPTLVPNIRTPYHFYDPEKKMFQPRIGLAYRLSEKTVIRTGYGIYYNVHQLNNYTILNLNPPLSGSAAFSNTASNGVITDANPITSQNPFGALSPTSLINANTLNRHDYEPRLHQWSFGVQRQLPWQSVLDVGYVGSKGVHLDNTVEKNEPDPGFGAVQARRPFPFVIDGPGGPIRPLSRIRWLDSGANSWYHGLQVSYQKNFSHGLQASLAYTYSKSEGEGYGRNESGTGFTTAGSYQDPRNRAADKGLYPFDEKHNAIISWLYELPTVPAFRQGVARQIFGGWQANGIWSLHTGLPFTVRQNNSLNTGRSPVRPDRIGNGTLSNPTINQWFNPDDFHVVTCKVSTLADLCHYGSSGEGILRGPDFKNLDFSLFKNFQIKESVKLQFRAEMFNIFNTPNFNPPNNFLSASTQFLPSAPGGSFPSQIRDQGPGQITSLALPMRQIQFGLKFLF